MLDFQREQVCTHLISRHIFCPRLYSMLAIEIFSVFCSPPGEDLESRPEPSTSTEDPTVSSSSDLTVSNRLFWQTKLVCQATLVTIARESRARDRMRQRTNKRDAVGGVPSRQRVEISIRSCPIIRAQHTQSLCILNLRMQ
jgi:hypothetical protein